MSLLLPLGSAVGIVLAVLSIREKLWPKTTGPHPLEAALRDVAAAIRESPPAPARPLDAVARQR